VRRRVRQAEIARQLGVSRAYVSDVIAGNRRSERVEAAVADALGLDAGEVFPARDSAASAAA
jgi:transcriptional regulator with XRE-family HTH domain